MSVSLSQISIIMVGGAFGAAARFLVVDKITERFGSHFPYGTISVNVIGSFFMGLLAMILVERLALDPLLRLGIFVGFLGSFTTFSTFSMDTLSLFEVDQHFRAVIYMLSSVIFSVLAVWLGALLGKALS